MSSMQVSSSNCLSPPALVLQTGCKSPSTSGDEASARRSEGVNLRGRSRSARVRQQAVRAGDVSMTILEARLQATPRPLFHASSLPEDDVNLVAPTTPRCRKRSASSSSGACSPHPGPPLALGHDARHEIAIKPPTPPRPVRFQKRSAKKAIADASGVLLALTNDWGSLPALEAPTVDKDAGEAPPSPREAPSAPPPPPPPPPLRRPPLDPEEVVPAGMQICHRALAGTCEWGPATCRRFHPSWRAAAQMRAYYASIPCYLGIYCGTRHCLFKHEDRMEPAQGLQATTKDEEVKAERESRSLMRDDSEESVKASPPRSPSPNPAMRSSSPESGELSPPRVRSPSLESGEASPPRLTDETLLPGATWLPKKLTIHCSPGPGGRSSDLSCSESTATDSESSCTSAASRRGRQSSRRGRQSASRARKHDITVRPAPPRQYLQKKCEPWPLFDAPAFTVISKPAGWEVGPREPMGSGVVDLEDYMTSGWIEPLRHYLALPRDAWKPVLSPGALASGWALVCRGEKAQRRLSHVVQSGQLHAISLALVRGLPDKQRAIAQNEAGFLEITVLAKYWLTHEGGWSGNGGVQHFTLLLLRSSGNACGGERRLLKLAWGKAACGDAENGGGDEVAPAPGTQAQIFFHNYAVAMLDPWADGAGLSIVCPLPEDLRASLATFCCEPEVACLHELLISGRQMLPPEVTGYAPSVSQAPAPQLQQLSEPSPFGATRWSKEFSKPRWTSAFVHRALLNPRGYGLRMSHDGYVTVHSLLQRFPILKEACFGNPWLFMYFLSKKDPTKAICVNGKRMDLRRRTVCERLQVFVEIYVAPLSPSTEVQVAELLENYHIRNLLCDPELPKHHTILRCLQPCPLFDVNSEAQHLTLRPLEERMRLTVEQLFTCPDAQLGQKLRESRGSVPLVWVLSKYSELLMGRREPGRSAPSLTTLAATLEGSPCLSIDCSTLRIAPRTHADVVPSNDVLRVAEPSELAEAANGVLCTKTEQQVQFASLRDAASEPICSERTKIRGWKQTHVNYRLVDQMTKLLRHYFLPFNLQNNRLLLHSAEAELSEDGKWQWSVCRVAQEMQRIGNIFLGLTWQLKQEVLEKVSQKYIEPVRLVWSSPDEMPMVRLSYPADFRQPVLRPICAPNWVKEYFLAARELLPNLPPLTAVILSYDLSGGEEAAYDRAGRKKRNGQVMRQCLTYTPDIVCVQRCEADLVAAASFSYDGSGAFSPSDNVEATLFSALRERLESEGYEWCAAPVCHPCSDLKRGDVNAIFWNRARWLASSWVANSVGGISATLQPQSEPLWQLTVGSLCSSSGLDLCGQLKHMKMQLPCSPAPSVLCGSFGTEPEMVGKAMQEEGIRGFRSANVDVLGKEMPWTSVVVDNTLSEGKTSVSCSNGIWLGGGGNSLSALAVVGGHTQPPQRTACGSICRSTLPTNHLPLVLAMEHHPAQLREQDKQ